MFYHEIPELIDNDILSGRFAINNNRNQTNVTLTSINRLYILNISDVEYVIVNFVT